MDLVKIIAIVVIGILESIALFKGVNGKFLALAFLFVGGIGGYSIAEMRFRIKKDKNKP